MKPAIFLDRDGTINEDIGSLYKIEDIDFIPGSLEALKLLQKDFLLFIITNQSGIGSGDFTLDQYIKFEHEYENILSEHDIHITETKCCPHTATDNCICRKPSIYFIEQLHEKYNVDLKKSFALGDHLHDPEMGSRTGGRGIYLLTGHGEKHLPMIDQSDYKPDFISNDLLEATKIILSL